MGPRYPAVAVSQTEACITMHFPIHNVHDPRVCSYFVPSAREWRFAQVIDLKHRCTGNLLVLVLTLNPNEVGLVGAGSSDYT